MAHVHFVECLTFVCIEEHYDVQRNIKWDINPSDYLLFGLCDLS